MRASTLAALAASTEDGTPAVVDDVLPRVLPVGWAILDVRDDGTMYGRRDGLKVIASGIMFGGHRWLHVSCSYATRLPTWKDFGDVKAIFVGADRYAYQVLPPRAKYVNFMPYCLHLWSDLDAEERGRSLPDFTAGGRML